MESKLLPKPIFSGVALILALLLICIPFQANLYSQDAQEVQTACLDGERQAQSDINGGTWFIIGCLAGLIGYLIALSEPNPPATQLLGKSPDYVAAYTDCYRRKGKDIKSKKALTGCLIGTLASAVVWTIVIVAAADESSSSSSF